MSAGSATFEVLELVRFEAQRFEARRRVIAVARPVLRVLVAKPLSKLTGLLDSIVAAYANKVARDLYRRAIWFRGVNQQVAEKAPSRPIDPEFSLVRLLDDLAAHVHSLHTQTEQIVHNLRVRGDAHTTVRHALQRVAVAASKLESDVLEFRLTIIARGEALGAIANAGDAATKYFSERDPAFALVHEQGAKIDAGISRLAKVDTSCDWYDSELLEEAQRTIASRRAS